MACPASHSWEAAAGAGAASAAAAAAGCRLWRALDSSGGGGWPSTAAAETNDTATASGGRAAAASGLQTQVATLLTSGGGCSCRTAARDRSSSGSERGTAQQASSTSMGQLSGSIMLPWTCSQQQQRCSHTTCAASWGRAPGPRHPCATGTTAPLLAATPTTAALAALPRPQASNGACCSANAQAVHLAPTTTSTELELPAGAALGTPSCTRATSSGNARIRAGLPSPAPMVLLLLPPPPLASAHQMCASQPLAASTSQVHGPACTASSLSGATAAAAAAAVVALSASSPLPASRPSTPAAAPFSAMPPSPPLLPLGLPPGHRAAEGRAAKLRRVPLAGGLLRRQAGLHQRCLTGLTLLPACLSSQPQQPQQGM